MFSEGLKSAEGDIGTVELIFPADEVGLLLLEDRVLEQSLQEPARRLILEEHFKSLLRLIKGSSTMERISLEANSFLADLFRELPSGFLAKFLASRNTRLSENVNFSVSSAISEITRVLRARAARKALEIGKTVLLKRGSGTFSRDSGSIISSGKIHLEDYGFSKEPAVAEVTFSSTSGEFNDSSTNVHTLVQLLRKQFDVALDGRDHTIARAVAILNDSTGNVGALSGAVTIPFTSSRGTVQLSSTIEFDQRFINVLNDALGPDVTIVQQ